MRGRLDEMTKVLSVSVTDFLVWFAPARLSHVFEP
jgi:hypothetical protein